MRKSITPIAIMLVVCAGCASERKTYTVKGTVIFDDGNVAKELVGGLVSFESLSDQSNAAGDIDADGAYRLKSPHGTDGVPAGNYRVLVMPPEPRDPDSPPLSILPERYRSYADSCIEVSVAEKVNDIPIKLRRK